jgi:hypothetical protein
MAIVFLIGTDDALLEGLAQTLAAAGHQPRVSHTVGEAQIRARDDVPLVAVVERALAASDAAALRLPLAVGGATLLYHAGQDPVPGGALSLTVQRLVMAELTLPLERHRLLALIQRVEERARVTGRGARGTDTPPEQRAH